MNLKFTRTIEIPIQGMNAKYLETILKKK